MSVHICLFFFFQAEDGIRDPLVTGVQTCALPICLVVEPERRRGAVRSHGARALLPDGGSDGGPQRVRGKTARRLQEIPEVTSGPAMTSRRRRGDPGAGRRRPISQTFRRLHGQRILAAPLPITRGMATRLGSLFVTLTLGLTVA